MPTRRARTWRILGRAGLVAGAGLLSITGCGTDESPRNPEAVATAPASESSSPESTRPAEAGAKGSNAQVSTAKSEYSDLLTSFQALVSPVEGGAPSAIPGGDADRVLTALKAVREAFGRLDPYKKVEVVQGVSQLFDRYTVEPAPGNWTEAINPAAELLTMAMADGSPAVRVAGTEAVSRIWVWKPGATLWPDQERALGTWKERLYTPVLAGLKDQEAGVRVTAVKCLGTLPIDAKAAPAVASLSDEHLAVRLQVLNSFAGRRDVMPDEDVLPRLYDQDGGIVLAARIVLRARGLEDEQIDLAKQLYHPDASERVAAIPTLLERSDIDPEVWLLQLSYDRDAAVRTEAVKALAGRGSSQARKRVSEMARTDPSDEVRAAANEILPTMTAGLPPLPGTPLASPTAN